MKTFNVYEKDFVLKQLVSGPRPGKQTRPKGLEKKVRK